MAIDYCTMTEDEYRNLTEDEYREMEGCDDEVLDYCLLSEEEYRQMTEGQYRQMTGCESLGGEQLYLSTLTLVQLTDMTLEQLSLMKLCPIAEGADGSILQRRALNRLYRRPFGSRSEVDFVDDSRSRTTNARS